MPKMSDTMEEGVIASWLVKEGDSVQSGDILAEVETDKATMELESYEDGTILYLGVPEKGSVPVDGVLAIIGKKGEDYTSLLSQAKPTNGTNGESNQSEESETKAAPTLDTSAIPANLITMPKMSDTMTEGTVVSWLKKVGDQVQSGDILAEVETDKATMELEAYEDGILLYVGVEAGGSVAVDDVLAVIGEKGADFQALIDAAKNNTASQVAEAPKDEQTSSATTSEPKKTTQQQTSTSQDGRIKASPLAKKMALDKGYDLSQIKGSGDNGRIVKRDIEQFTPAANQGVTSTSVGQESYEEFPVSQMRKTIARRLSESKFTAPHFYLTMEIEMDKAMTARKSMNEVSPVKISFNDLVMKSVSMALRQHPKVNAGWHGDHIRVNHHIHIGMAVAVDEGLLVPVIRFTDTLSLSQIAEQTKALAKKAQEKKLQPQEWEGNTFTVSNLGMFGIEEFTAIINPPDACILAVGGIKPTALVKNGELVPGHVMKVTLSCDHRVVDGAMGAAFLQTLKQLLEDPVRILV